MSSFAKALSPAIREIRILCCQTGPASSGARFAYLGALLRNTRTEILFLIIYRQFISSTYPTLKQHNPDLPILIREAKGTPARVFARFGALDNYTFICLCL